MKLLNSKELEAYVKDNYELIVEDKDAQIPDEIADHCDVCKRDVFLKVWTRTYDSLHYLTEFPRFAEIYIQCPSCSRTSFIHTIQYDKGKTVESPTGTTHHPKYHLYRLGRLPVQEEKYINEDIPADQESLRKTASEADFCLGHAKYIASTILFRRAIQIIAKDILGGKGKSLHQQLEWLKSNENSLKSDLTDVFHDNAKIIKDIGNQGAHPDKDITLHSFSKEEAYGMHDLFISIIHEIYVKPAKLKSLQDDLKSRRKL